MHVARAESGLPPARGHARRSPRRARAGSRRLRRALGFAAVLPRVRGDRGRRCWRWWPRSSTRPRGDLDGSRVARRSRSSRSRRSPPPGTCSRSSPPSGCDDRRLRRADPGPAARGAALRRSTRWPRQRGVERRRRRWSATAGSRPACPTACAASALAEDVGIPAGRNAGVAGRRAASCCSSSTTTRGSPRRTRSRASPARFDAEPDARAAPAARRRRATAARAPRDWVPRLRVGDPHALERRDRRVGGRGGDPRARCSSRSAAGRPSSASSHEGVDLAWRVMDAGYRVPTRATSRRCTRAYADRAARLLGLLRRAQPGVARPPPPAAAARRAVRRGFAAPHAAACCARASARPRGAARLPRRAARPVRRRGSRCARRLCGG